MITCLKDYIGLKDISNTPLSGRFVNELQGIDTRQFELIESLETYDSKEAWQKIEHRSIKKFESVLNTWAIKYYSNYSYVSNVVTGQYNDNIKIPNTANYAGWLFDGNLSFFKNMNLQIPSINIHSDVNVNTDILVFNASTGDLLDTINVDLIGGQINTVVINKQYSLWKYPRLFIAYDESEVTTLKAKDFIFTNTVNFTQKRIDKNASIISGNFSSVGNTGQGMILTYSIECALDNFVCQRLRLFEEPYLYMLGIEFCNERIHSDRISQYTLLDRDRAIELRTEFQETFDNMIKGILTGLKVDYGNNDFCFACDRAMTYKTLLP